MGKREIIQASFVPIEAIPASPRKLLVCEIRSYQRKLGFVPVKAIPEERQDRTIREIHDKPQTSRSQAQHAAPKPMPLGLVRINPQTSLTQIRPRISAPPRRSEKRAQSLDTLENEARICAYCGEFADSRDHVLPRSYIARMADVVVLHTELVWCCRECNSLAEAKVFPSFQAKKQYIKSALKRRYKRLLTMPEWSDTQLEELGYTLRSRVKASIHQRDIVRRRISF